MNKTGIEYLTHTWNPTHGCTPISEGCRECWAEGMSKRLAGMGKKGYSKEDPFKPTFCPWKLEEPLRRKKPAVIGVSFMGDLFHGNIPFDLIAAIFGVMSFCQQHTFIVLTKRACRMAMFFNHHNGDYKSNFNWWLNEACLTLPENMTKGIRLRPRPDKFPLPNVWLGVSVESDKYRWRIEELIKIPGKHFISYEPALGSLDVKKYLMPSITDAMKAPNARCGHHGNLLHGRACPDCFPNTLNGVIAGCESGPNRRHAKVEWFRDLKNQCVSARVPFFLKQMTQPYMFGHQQKTKVIKMPFLDGQIWNELPF